MKEQGTIDVLSQETRRFYRLYHEKISRRVRAVLGDALTPVQYLLLGIITEEGPISMSEIGERVTMQKQQVTSVINQLEEKGLVTRARRSENRRVVWLEATPRARELEEEIVRQTQQAFRSLFESLTDEETEEYLQAMQTANRLLARLPGGKK